LKRAWMVAGTVAVFLPTVFVMWLVVAANWKKMDAVTAHMPEGVRSLVVQAMLGISRSDESMKRAVKLDAAAVTEWQQRQKVVQLSSVQGIVNSVSVNSERAVELNKRGMEEEKAGHDCAAEEIFSQAASASSGGNYYSPAEHMGRTALRCGDLGSARAGLETAVFKEDKSLKDDDADDDADDIKETNADMLKDREYLVVVYQRQHEAALVAATCRQAHAGWKGCACGLDAKGDVQCREKR
jgi:hypothetical protein